MDAAFFKTLVTDLGGDRPPPVWSLLVTVFGDLALERDARISAPVLGQLSELIGVKPQAKRVALHRLRKDGWIDSARRGRSSDYFLTDWGRTQSAEASPRIYAGEPAHTTAWMVLSDPGQPADFGPGSFAITPNMALATNQPERTDVIAMAIDPSTTLPDWVTSKVCDPITARSSQNLSRQLADLHKSLGNTGAVDFLEVAALRVLVVHSWRRIVLRTPALPNQVFPQNWAGAACRAEIARLLRRLPKPNLDDLERAVSVAQERLDPAAPRSG